jgi:hypothetical protein
VNDGNSTLGRYSHLDSLPSQLPVAATVSFQEGDDFVFLILPQLPVDSLSSEEV